MTRPSVLVCDDEPNLRELIRVSLGSGWTVHAAVAAALVTLFALLLVAILSYRDASTTARHAQQAIASANQLETLALDLETGLRGFIITRKQGSLKPWRDARKRYDPDVRQFLRLPPPDPPPGGGGPNGGRRIGRAPA